MFYRFKVQFDISITIFISEIGLSFVVILQQILQYTRDILTHSFGQRLLYLISFWKIWNLPQEKQLQDQFQELSNVIMKFHQSLIEFFTFPFNTDHRHYIGFSRHLPVIKTDIPSQRLEGLEDL